MAGNKIDIAKKIRASSLTEAVIAMVIITLVFGMAMMIYTNIIRLSLSVKKLRAQAVLEDKLLRVSAAEIADGLTERVGEYRVEQTVHSFDREGRLVVIRLIAYDENEQQLAQLQQVITHER